jgi:hypothetical protein
VLDLPSSLRGDVQARLGEWVRRGKVELVEEQTV